MNFRENETSQKLRGGYYTPDDLAGFLMRWVGNINPRKILEPSCGDGAFLAAAARSNLKASQFEAFELDETEASKAASRAASVGLQACVRNEDFLAWALRHMGTGEAQFDAVVGNPPFIRYQYLPELFQSRAEEVFRLLECKFTKHTNAWVPFILASFEMLRPGGRLAMVVPSEIIHVMHAQSLRSYLGRECRRLVIVDPEEIWFTETLQGVVLLLAEKRHHSADHAEGLGFFAVRGREFAQGDPEEIFLKPQPINGKTVAGKWTRAILAPTARELVDEICQHSDVHTFASVADVDVGIVTGANKFFLVDDDTVESFELTDWAHPMFGRSEHCPGIIYDQSQHRNNASRGNPTNFVWFRDQIPASAKGAKSYIKLGESQKLHTRYKCRIRSPWYTVPSVYSTEIGMLKRAHDVPRLILNEIGAYTTDTAYRIRSHRASAKQLVTHFLNPLTALSAELEGRHYGGGVLELVPSEIEKMIVPLPKGNEIDIRDLDKAVRSMPAEDVLAQYGHKILGPLGLSKKEEEVLLAGWRQLRDRRQRLSSEDLAAD